MYYDKFYERFRECNELNDSALNFMIKSGIYRRGQRENRAFVDLIFRTKEKFMTHSAECFDCFMLYSTFNTALDYLINFGYSKKEWLEELINYYHESTFDLLKSGNVEGFRMVTDDYLFLISLLKDFKKEV